MRDVTFNLVSENYNKTHMLLKVKKLIHSYTELNVISVHKIEIMKNIKKHHFPPFKIATDTCTKADYLRVFSIHLAVL